MDKMVIDATNDFLAECGDKRIQYSVRIDNKGFNDILEPMTGLVIEAQGHVEFDIIGKFAYEQLGVNLKQLCELHSRDEWLLLTKTAEVDLMTQPSGDGVVSPEPSETVGTANPDGESVEQP